MKLLQFIAFAGSLALLSCNQQAATPTKDSLATEVDSVSYALGLDMANKLKGDFDEIDKNLFIQGFNNGVDSTNLLIEADKVTPVLMAYFQKKQAETQKKRQEEQLAKLEEQYAEVKKAGEAFLADNKTKEGVKTTESGLQYKVVKEGSGAKPVATDKVKVHYHGTLADGTVFDSSVERGEPVSFPLNGVIKGWTEGLQLMPVGSKFKFFIPQELAYGAFPRGGGPIKPFSALVFDVELLDIEKPQEKAVPTPQQ